MHEFIITLREGFEATLLVGIMYRWLSSSQPQWLKGLWAGLAAAGMLGLGLFALLVWLGTHLPEQEMFEAVLYYSTAGILIYTMAWLHRQQNPASQLKQDLQQAGEKGLLAVALLAVVAMGRESLETAALLASVRLGAGSLGWGWLLGLAVSAGLGWLVFVAGKRLPMASFFRLTTFMLLLMAAGMAANATHELHEFIEEEQEEAGLPGRGLGKPLFELTSAVPASQAPASYTVLGDKAYPPLHHKGWLGMLLNMLTGYRANPRLAEIGVWLCTMVLGLGVYYWAGRQQK